jgi:hypothetical protein
MRDRTCDCSMQRLRPGAGARSDARTTAADVTPVHALRGKWNREFWCVLILRKTFLSPGRACGGSLARTVQHVIARSHRRAQRRRPSDGYGDEAIQYGASELDCFVALRAPRNDRVAPPAICSATKNKRTAIWRSGGRWGVWCWCRRRGTRRHQAVGRVERSETHQSSRRNAVMGFASAQPTPRAGASFFRRFGL